MKPINKLKLSSDEVHVVDLNLMLELNSCGRGFITAQTDIDYTGKLVRLEVGYPELLLRWFTGFVERSQPAENGFQKLFVRELVGVFDKPWPCSFQHPTLKTIIDYLRSNSGLTFHLPNSNYVNQPIPHFTHAGTGYQLLAILGQSFAIDDYIWMQLPDGSVYVGSWPDSPFADKPVDIPPEFSQSQSGGNSMTVPLIQTIRPGVNINGQRISKVNLLNENIILTWQTANKLTGKAESKTPIQRQIESAFPELSAGLHLPMQARVIAPAESAQRGDMSDPFRPKYAVDVQLLDSNGNPTDAPVYPAVPLPLPMAGGESGMFQYPPEGSLVEIAFTGGRPDKPFIRQTLSAGNTLPDIQPGEQLQQQREEVSQRVTAAGDWIRKTDQTINESSMRRLITADAETRTVTARER